MRASSSLTEDQRLAAVMLFESGHGCCSAAKKMGAGAPAVRSLHERWRVRGRGALVEKPDRRKFDFELKLTVVQRVLAGEKKLDLVREFELSSVKIIDPWLRAYRLRGEDGLRPKRVGRPPDSAEPDTTESGELARLRAENERLRTQVAYLGKLRALRAQERQ